MKNKLLLLGNNKRLITDFFMQMDFAFDCVSSSTIVADLKAHYKFFKPDAIVYCMRAEGRDNITGVVGFLESTVKHAKTPFVVIADASDYEFWTKTPGAGADLRIGVSAPLQEIQSEISNAIRGRKHHDHHAHNHDRQKPDGNNMANIFDTLAKLETGLGGKAGGLASELDLDKLLKKEAGDSGRPRILVIDDSTIIHKAIKNYIGKEYDISAAISGMAALRFLQAKEVNAILLDYEMPGMDGIEVIEQIRRNPLTEDIPVIFLTGVDDTDKIQSALKYRPNGYLLKPVDRNVLLNKLKEVLG